MEYKCEECANKLTPLCGICSQVKTTRGILRRPKYFVALTRMDVEGGNICTAPKSELVRAIETFLDAGVPIPLALCITYNHLAEEA